VRARRAVAILVLLAASTAALAQSPELRGLLSKAVASEAAGKLIEAEAIYREALTAAQTDEERAEVISRLGEVRRRRGDRLGALAAYQQALELEGDGPWLSRCLTQLASLAQYSRQPEIARSAYERLLTDFAANPVMARQAAIGLARLDAEAGDLEGAIKRLEQLLAGGEATGLSYQARRQLVEYLIGTEQFQRAVEVARGGASKGPEQTDLLLLAADALLDANQPDRAEQLCRQVLAAEPDNEAAGHLLYEVSSQRGALDELEDELQEQATGPHRGSALRRLAELYSRRGDDERALAVYEQLLKDAPEDPELLYRGGSLARDAGDLDKAEQYLRRLVAVEPDDRSGAQALGEVYIRQGKPEKALDTFKAATDYRPDDPRSAQALGRILSRYSLFHQAVEVYERARRELGDQNLLAYDMGRAFVGLMDYEKATPEFLKALAEPSGPSPRLVSYELERLARDEIAGEAVLATLDAWAEQEGGGDEQLLVAARAYIAADRPERGVALVERLGAEAGLALLELAREQEAEGERDLAADLYEAVLKRRLEPEHRGLAALRLTELRLAQGRWREALSLLENSPAAPGEESHIALLRADLLLRFVRDVDAGTEAYQDVLSQAGDGTPGTWHARWGLAGCLFAAGQWEGAEQAYRALMEEAREGLLLEAPPPPPGHAAYVMPGLMQMPPEPDQSRTSAAYAAIRLAEISLRRQDLEEAAARFAKVAREHRASAFGNDALERLAFIKENLDGQGEAEGEYLRALGMLDRGEWDRAEALLEEIAAQRAEPLADDALMLLAQSWVDREEPARAVEVYEELAEEFPESLLAPTALLDAAHLLLERLSHLAEGRSCLIRIRDTYPDSAAADEARDLLELLPTTS